MYGIFKEKEKINSLSKFKILGNDGNYYSYIDDNKKYKSIKMNQRVVFTLRNGKVQNMTIAEDTPVKGQIIKYLNQNSGLIQTVNGEILYFKAESTSVPALYQFVLATPALPSVQKNVKFGEAEKIQILHYSVIDEKLKEKVAVIFRSEIGLKKNACVQELISCLQKHEISPEEYGFFNPVLFLEQFANVLRFYDDLIEIFDESEISEFYPEAVEILHQQGYSFPTLLQERTFRDRHFWNDNKIFIMGTTSSGKTAIPLIRYIIDFKRSIQHPKMLIAVNLRTLTTQMQETIRQKYQKIYPLNVQISTSEYIEGDNQIKNGDVDIAVVIYEKLFIFASTVDNFFSKYDYLVLDEIGIIENPERGAKVETLLIKATEQQNLNLLLLATPYDNWKFYINKYNFYPVRIYSRPVQVHEFFYYPVEQIKKGCHNIEYCCADANGNSLKVLGCDTFGNLLNQLCWQEWNVNHKVLVFSFSQAKTKQLSQFFYRYIRKKNNLPEVKKTVLYDFISRFFKCYHLSFEEMRGILDTDEDYEALYYGIAFHNASVPENMRIAVEQEFLLRPNIVKNGINIVFATDTLAYGLNSNVDTVIVTHLERFADDKYQNISYNNYQNCIGRSGRLGYRDYGTSYTFVSKDFEKKYFDSFAKASGIPKKTISYYTASLYEEENKFVCGTFGSLLSMADFNRLAFYILSILPMSGTFSEESLFSQLRNVPTKHVLSEQELYQIISRSLEFLLKENMICQNEDYTAFSDDAVTDYLVTEKGKSFQGYAISVNSFQKMQYLLGCLFVDNHICLFDYFMQLCQFEEVSSLCRHFLISFPENEKNAERDIQALTDLIHYMLPRLHRKHWISESLYEKITTSLICQKALQEKRLKQEEFNFLKDIRVALISCMWVSGYGLQLINEIQQFNNDRIDNIRRKIGEKFSYMTDIVCAVSQVRYFSEEKILLLKQLSICLFYGINLDWLIQSQISELSSSDAAQWHVASLYASRYQFLEEQGTEKEKDQFKWEYARLDDTIKRILKQKGVTISG